MDVYPFDTELTLLYKKAFDSNLPVEMFLIRREPKEILSTQDLIEMYEDMSLFEIYNQISEVEAKVKDFPKILAWNYLFAYGEKIDQYVVRLPRLEILERDTSFLSLIREVVTFYRDLNFEIPGLSDKILDDYLSGADVDIRLIVERVLEEYKQFLRLQNPSSTEQKNTRDISEKILSDQKLILEQQEKSSIEDYYRSPFVKRSETIVYDLLNEDGSKVLPKEGASIFDQSISSNVVPYIEYTSTETRQSYFRVYVAGNPSKYSKRVRTVEKPSRGNHFYIKMVFQHPYSLKSINVEDALESQYVYVRINLEDSTLEFDLPYNKLFSEDLDEFILENNVQESYGARSISEWVILENFFQSFAYSNLLLGKREEKDVKVDVSVYGVDLDGVTWSYFLTDPNTIAQDYMYIEEFTKPEALNNQIKFWYRPYPLNDPKVPRIFIEASSLTSRTLTASITQEYTSLGLSYPALENDESIRVAFEANTPYVNINIIRNASLQSSKEFISMFTAMLPLYEVSKENTLDSLSRFYKKSEMKLLFPPPPSLNVTKGIQLIKLADAIPIFKSGLSRQSQLRFQTKIIQYQDLEEWVSGTFRHNNKTYHREALAFPKPEPVDGSSVLLARYHNGGLAYFVETIKEEQRSYEWLKPKDFEKRRLDLPEAWVVCPENGLFLDVKVNTTPETAQIYEYIPHCFKKVHIPEDPLASEKSGFSYYYLGKERKEVETKVDYIAKSNKILSLGNKGHLNDPSIKSILEKYSRKSERSEFIRFGVPHSPNSLLHSVLIALNDPEYKASEDKENYVREVRKAIAEVTLPEILQQELFDKTKEEIYMDLRDPNVYLDPAIYYRALESFFDISIYTYTYQSETKTPDLLVPRNLLFHVSTYRSKPTVLILKNSGISTDTLEYPQSELIMEYQKGKEFVALFEPEMGKIHFDLMNEINQIYVWRIRCEERMPELETLELNLSQVDYETIFKDTIESQIIDEYGKLRAIVFKIPESKDKVSIFVHPSQPLNRPSANFCLGNSETMRIPKAKAEVAVEFFGPPKQITKDYLGNINGFWFGNPSLFFVPIQPLSPKERKKYDSLTVGPLTPFDVEKDQRVERLKALESNLGRLQQLLWWVWKIENQSRRTPISIDRFWDKYMAYDADTEESLDSAFYYYLGGIPRILPTVLNAKEALKYLEEQEEKGILEDLLDPGLIYGRWVKEGKMVCYNEDFYNKLKVWLTKRWNLSSQRKQKIPQVLTNYYVLPQDFQSQNDEAIFIGKQSFKKWLKNASQYQSQYIVQKTIDVKAALSSDPYLFQEKQTKKIYMIQNVQQGNLQRALHVAQVWNRDKINLGILATPIEDFSDLNYHVFANSNRNKLVLVRGDPSKTRGAPLKILQYNTQEPIRYAALLELL